MTIMDQGTKATKWPVMALVGEGRWVNVLSWNLNGVYSESSTFFTRGRVLALKVYGCKDTYIAKGKSWLDRYRFIVRYTINTITSVGRKIIDKMRLKARKWIPQGFISVGCKASNPVMDSKISGCVTRVKNAVADLMDVLKYDVDYQRSGIRRTETKKVTVEHVVGATTEKEEDKGETLRDAIKSINPKEILLRHTSDEVRNFFEKEMATGNIKPHSHLFNVCNEAIEILSLKERMEAAEGGGETCEDRLDKAKKILLGEYGVKTIPLTRKEIEIDVTKTVFKSPTVVYLLKYYNLPEVREYLKTYCYTSGADLTDELVVALVRDHKDNINFSHFYHQNYQSLERVQKYLGLPPLPIPDEVIQQDYQIKAARERVNVKTTTYHEHQAFLELEREKRREKIREEESRRGWEFYNAGKARDGSDLY